MADLIRIKRGTRAQLDAAAGTSALYEAEPYLIADEDRIAIGLSVDAYAAMAKHAELADLLPKTGGQLGTVTHSVVTVSSPGAAQIIALDGRMHVIELEDGQDTEITGTPGTGYSSAIVRLKGSPAGTGTASWATGHLVMNGQSSSPAANAYVDFLLDSHDGTTVIVRGVGATAVADGTGPAILTGDDIGTTIAAQGHDHSGVYEPADATILKSSAIGSTLQGYDEDTAKYDVVGTWTATQSFSTVQGAVTTKTATAAETIPLDGRMHILTLADGQATVITGSATTAGQYATLVLIGSPAGTGSITWAAGHVAMNGQVLNPAAGAYTDFALDSPDGTTVRYRGVGVEP